MWSVACFALPAISGTPTSAACSARRNMPAGGKNGAPRIWFNGWVVAAEPSPNPSDGKEQDNAAGGALRLRSSPTCGGFIGTERDQGRADCRGARRGDFGN